MVQRKNTITIKKTEAVDTYVNPGNIKKAIVVDKPDREAYFQQHAQVKRLLLREKHNPLLEEGRIEGKVRDREGEYYLTYEALSLLVESTLKKYKNKSGANTRHIFIMKNDAEKLIKLLRSISFNVVDFAKIIYIEGVHAVPFLIGMYKNKMHVFMVDSEAGIIALPETIIHAVRTVFPNAVIAFSNVLLQKDFYSCSTFAFKTLLYFIKHGQNIFPTLYQNEALSESNKDTFIRIPCEKMMPALLKMVQSKIVFPEHMLNSVVSLKSGITLGGYLNRYQYQSETDSFNSAALIKKYLYMTRVDKYVSSMLTGQEIDPSGRFPLPGDLQYIHAKYDSLQDNKLHTIKLINDWLVKASHLLRDADDSNKEILNRLNDKNYVSALLKQLHIPQQSFSMEEYGRLLPFILVSLREQNNADTQDAATYTAKLIAAFGNGKAAITYLKRYYKHRQGVAHQLLHDACLYTLPETEAWSLPIWQRVIADYPPHHQDDTVLRYLHFADKIENKAKDSGTPISIGVKAETLADYLKTFTYERAYENPQAAILFYQHGLGEEYFNKWLDLKPQNDDKLVPYVMIKGHNIAPEYRHYYITKLAANDPRNAILGKLTNCCQSIDGVGKECAKDGIINPGSGFYVLMYRDKHGRDTVMSQCWVWSDGEGQLVFDSIESKLEFQTNHEQMIADFYMYLAQHLVNNYSISRVSVGRGGHTPDRLEKVLNYEPAQPVNYSEYRDSKKQAILADRHHPILAIYTLCNQSTKLRANKTLEQAYRDMTRTNLNNWFNHCYFSNLDKKYFLAYMDESTARLYSKHELWHKFIQNEKPHPTNQQLKSLLLAGIDINVRSRHGSSSMLDVMLTRKKYETAAFLLAQGAKLDGHIHDDELYPFLESEHMQPNFFPEFQRLLHIERLIVYRHYKIIGYLPIEKILEVVKENKEVFAGIIEKKASDLIHRIMQYDMEYVVARLNLDTKLLNSLILELQWEILKILVANGLSLQMKNYNTYNTMDMLRYYEAFDFLKWLHANGFPIHNTDKNLNILDRFSMFENWDMLLWGIKNGLDPNQQDQYGNTCMRHAPLCPLETFKTIVTEHKFDLGIETSWGDTVIFQFCDRDNIDCLQFSAEHGANILHANKNSETPLHRAAQHNSKHSTEYLVKRYPDLNIKDKKGNTPLHLAANWDQLETVQILVAAGADINAKNNDGHTIFDFVLFNLSKDYSKVTPLLRWLITEKGMDVNYKFAGKTPLYLLLSNNRWKSIHDTYGDVDGANWLIDLGGIINGDDNGKMLQCSHFIYSNRERYLPLLLRILENKMQIDVFALVVSAVNGRDQDVLDVIIRNYSVDINAQHKSEGYTALHRCVFANYFLDTVKFVLNLGANPNIADTSGRTPLHVITNRRDKADEILVCLLDAGAKVNIQDANGNTPLHLSIENKTWEHVRILLDRNADITIKNACDATAKDMITWRKNDIPADIKERFFINEVIEEAVVAKPSL